MPATASSEPNDKRVMEESTVVRIRSGVMGGVVLGLTLMAGCTQERQNQIKRDIQNWTGTNGVLEVYAGDKVVKRFLKIDKLSTALGTDDNAARSYRYGYGVLDENLNGQTDSDEKRVYFEVGDYSQYVFFENPR